MRAILPAPNRGHGPLLQNPPMAPATGLWEYTH